jgi:anti-sigma B factor antagonist
MPVDIERYGDVVVAKLEDELIEDSVARLTGALEASLAQGIRQLVIDFEKTEQLDSAGLETLLDISEKVQQANGSVKISGLSETCRKVFEMTRFDKRFELFGSLLDAVKSFR